MSDVENLNIALTRGQVASLNAAVEAGEYSNTSEIVREAVQDWQIKHAHNKMNSTHKSQYVANPNRNKGLFRDECTTCACHT